MRVLKWNLPPVGEQRVALYRGTRLLSVGWQGEQLVVWTESPGEGDLIWHFVTVVLTGGDVPEGQYIGTAQLKGVGGEYVVHVYVREEGEVAP